MRAVHPRRRTSRLSPLASLTSLSRAPLLAGLLAAAACLHPQRARTPPPRPLGAVPAARPVAIVHATIWTADARGTKLRDGTIVLREGRIAAVGDRTTTVPPDAEVIDAAGRPVTPGLIDAHSHLGVYASPAVEAHEDGNEMVAPNTAEVDALHALWPQDPGLPRALAGGVTSLLVLPGSANVIGGRGVTIKNRPGRGAAALRFPGAPGALKIACGENPKRVYGKKGGPATRMGNVAHLRAAFTQARDYMRKWDQWEGRPKSKRGDPPARDLKLETLAEVLRGRLLVQNHCYRADEMLLMLDVAAELGFSIRAFHHALEAYKIADVLAQRRVAVATWADWWGFKLEAWDGIPENLALVQAAGARAIVHSDSAIGVQRLNQAAAQGLAVGREMGLPLREEDALRWITANPAWALGIEERTGSLEVGKMADVVLWTGHPFSVYSHPDKVFVDGELVHDRAKGARPTDFELGLGVEAAGETKPDAAPAGGAPPGARP
jgi:imidazolonepropionase-like amidohydrolase